MSYTVKLASGHNHDFPDDHGGTIPTEHVKVATITEAAQRCREYIVKHNLGGGNWIGGEISENGKIIARVSYNGRIWTPDLTTPYTETARA